MKPMILWKNAYHTHFEDMHMYSGQTKWKLPSVRVTCIKETLDAGHCCYTYHPQSVKRTALKCKTTLFSKTNMSTCFYLNTPVRAKVEKGPTKTNSIHKIAELTSKLHPAGILEKCPSARGKLALKCSHSHRVTSH